MTQTENLEYNEKISESLKVINTSPIEALVTFLCTESLLQAVLVITALEPEKASCTLEHTPEHIRKPIIASLTRSIQMYPDVYEKIIADAAETIRNIQADKKRRVSAGFMTELEDSMPELNSRTVKSILNILKETDSERSCKIRSAIVAFEDIMLLDNRSVQKVLREAQIEEFAAVLINAPEALKQKVSCNMSKRVFTELEKYMKTHYSQLIKVKEEMQDRIAAIMCRLEKSKEISIPRHDDDAVIN